jgi:uncharacterized protein (TIGR02145 family)
MQIHDPHNFQGGLNADDSPNKLPQGDYVDATNIRTNSSDEEHGEGNAETLQGEIEVLINPFTEITYYGQAIGGQFIYQGFDSVTIGTQTWMKKNFGGDYPGSKVYNDDENNQPIYGRLYQHIQIMSSDFCPPGWRVPTEADFDTLMNYLGGLMLAGGNMKEVGDSHWQDPNTGAQDISGFRALPGGKFDEVFDLLGFNGILWVADDGGPLPPVALPASVIQPFSFIANWEAEDGVDGYKLDVSEFANFSSFVTGYDGKDVGNVTTLLVDGLSKVTNYYYRIRAYNEVGESDSSNVITLQTLNTAVPANPLLDLDNNEYHTVVIGNLEIIVENLKVTQYADHSPIPLVTDDAEWAGQAPVNYKNTYGALYNWYVVNTGKLAPAGWHLPTEAEWEALWTYLGADDYVGGKLKETGTAHWKTPNTGADNSSDFSGNGSGMRQYLGLFTSLLQIGTFWSSENIDDYEPDLGVAEQLTYNSAKFDFDVVYPKYYGLSVRLIKDDSTDPGTVTDIDGNVYNTFKIGDQVWMTSNLKVEHFNDGTIIPMVSDNAAWVALTTPGMCYFYNTISTEGDAYCWYDNDINNDIITD